eukprot:2429752-Pyramimonas_sp.AAC.1
MTRAAPSHSYQSRTATRRLRARLISHHTGGGGVVSSFTISHMHETWQVLSNTGSAMHWVGSILCAIASKFATGSGQPP